MLKSLVRSDRSVVSVKSLAAALRQKTAPLVRGFQLLSLERTSWSINMCQISSRESKAN